MMTVTTLFQALMSAAGITPPTAFVETYLDPVSRHTLYLGMYNGDQTIRRDNTGGGSSENVKSNIGYSTGKRYFEFRLDATTGSANNYHMIGIAPATTPAAGYPGSTSDSWGLEWQTGLVYNNLVSIGTGSASGAAVGDIISVAVDFDAGKIWFGKNGTWTGNPVAGTGNSVSFTPSSKVYYVCASLYNINTSPTITARLKRDEMRYNSPTGFSAWAVPNSPWQDAVVADEPVGFFRFNEWSGDVVFHDVVSDTVFTSSQGTHTSSESGWVGPGGRALNVTSNSTYLTASSSTAYRVTGDVTGVFAFALSSLPASGTYWVLGQVAGSGEGEAENSIFQVCLDNNAVSGMGVRFIHEYGAGTNEDVRVSFPFIAAPSYVLHVERDTVAKTYTVYVNGELIGSVGYANNPTGGTNSNLFLVGNLGISGGSTTNTFIGNYDEFAFFNKKIGAARVLAQYEAMISDMRQFVDLFDTNTIANYTQYSDTAGAWSISGGNLTCVGGGQSVLTLNGLACNRAKVKLTQADDAGIVLRFADNSNYYVAVIADASSGTGSPNRISLYKRVGGTYTQVGSNVSISFTRGTEHEFEYKIIGTYHIIKFDGATVLTATDTAHAWNNGGGGGPRNANYAGDANATSIFTEFKCYPIDHNYLSTVTHLDFDGAEGSQNFRDRCGKRMSWYNYTDNAIGFLTTVWKKWGVSSLSLATGSTLRGLTSQQSANFTMGSGSWRITFWYKPETVGTSVVLDMRPAGGQGAYICLYHLSDGSLRYYVNTADRISSAAGAIVAGGEYFIEINKDSTSNTTRLFINGALIGTWSDTTSYLGTVIKFGDSSQNPGTVCDGWFDDLVIKKGVGGYGLAYPVAPFPAPRGAHC